MTTEARSSAGRGLLRLFQRRETFWGVLSADDREYCIDRKTRRTFGGIEAFDIAGVLRTRWNEEIYPKIRQLLQSRKAWIFKQVGTEVLYAFHLYVTANAGEIVPSFVAICYRIDVAQRIIKLVKSSRYLEDIGLHYYSFNSYLNSTGGTGRDDLHVNSTNVCGELIYILRGDNPPRRCTLGGCIKLDDRVFGLTIAHVLFDEVPPSEQGDSFTDDVQSQMKLVLESDDDSSLTDWAISEVEKDPDFSEDQNIEVSPDLSRCFWSMEYPESAKFHGYRLLAAKREQLPICQVDVRRDWLLTTFEELLPFHEELQESFPSYHNELKKPSGEVVMIHDIQYEPVDTNVSLCLGSSTSSRPAYISTTLTGLYLPTTRAVVDTWSCTSTATTGDSGSWAVDDNGYVYGTIVASNEASKTSYVIPMRDTIASIKARNPGLAISFPVGPELDRRNAKLEDVRDSDHSSSAYQEDTAADTSITAGHSTTIGIVYEASPRLASPEQSMSEPSSATNRDDGRDSSMKSTSRSDTIEEPESSASPARLSSLDTNLIDEIQADSEAGLSAAVETAYDKDSRSGTTDTSLIETQTETPVTAYRDNLAVDSQVNPLQQEISAQSNKIKLPKLIGSNAVKRHSHQESQFYDDDDDAEEERVLEEMAQGYGFGGFHFDKQSKSALSRQSGSSGFSGRTWPSSNSSTVTQTQTSGHPTASSPIPGRLRLPPILPLPTASADSRSLPKSSSSSPLAPRQDSVPQPPSPYTLSGSQPSTYGNFSPQERSRPGQAVPISFAGTSLPPRKTQAEFLVPLKRHYDRFPETLHGLLPPLSIPTPASSYLSAPIGTMASFPILGHNLTFPRPPSEVSSNTTTSRCSLHIRQQPRTACAGRDSKSRHCIDPPPILQLLLTDFSPDSATDISELESNHYVVLCKLIPTESPRGDVTTHTTFSEDRLLETSRLLLGTNVALPFFCADDPEVETMPQHPRSVPTQEDPPSPSSRFITRPSPPPIDPQATLPGIFFIFADLLIRRAGLYRLQFTLMKMEPGSQGLPMLDVVVSNAFQAVNAKDFDQVRPSTRLVEGLLERGAPFPLKLIKDAREGRRRREAVTEGDGGSPEGSNVGREDLARGYM